MIVDAAQHSARAMAKEDGEQDMADMADSLRMGEAQTRIASTADATADGRADSGDALPVVLTAQPLLRSRPDLASALSRARLDVRAVASWERLPEGVERIAATIVLVDMDAADRGDKGRHALSSHRIVTLLARQLAGRDVALVVLTSLDFAEIEDLARAGVSALVPPSATTKALVGHLCAARARLQRRHASSPDVSNGEGEATPMTQTRPVVPARTPRKTALMRAAADDDWRLPDVLWRELAGVLPCERRPARTRVSDRQILEALFYLLRTGAPWSALPRSFGSPQTVRRRLRAWDEAGVLDCLETLAARERSYLQLLDWKRLTHTRALAGPVSGGSRMFRPADWT